MRLKSSQKTKRDAARPTIVTGIGWAAVQVLTFNHVFVDFYASRPRRTGGGGTSSRKLSASENLYNAGVIVGLCGLCFIPLFLAFQVSANLYGIYSSYKTVSSLNSTTNEAVAAGRSAPTLLLPGITTPLSDLPIILSASFLAIVIHELGHAMAAGLAGVPLVSVGFLLVCLFPGAYVSLANEETDLLAPLQRLRIICAGVWHNFVLVLALWALGKSGISASVSNTFFFWLGYQSTHDRGVLLTHLAKTSPLVGLLVPGTMITHLDNFELHDSEHWDRYLLADTSSQLMQSEDVGWCLPLEELISRPNSCCEAILGNYTSQALQSSGKREVCFVGSGVNDRQAQRGCLDPSTILDKPRCIEECYPTNDICIRPAAQERLLRISTLNTYSTAPEIAPSAEVMFYQGDRLQLWKETRVGDLIPPRWLPLSLHYYISLFFDYLRTISLSLGMLNLLPLPRLDGGELLQVLLYAQVATLPRPNASLRESHTWSTENIVHSILQSRFRKTLASRGKSVELLVAWIVGSLLSATVALAIWREVLSR